MPKKAKSTAACRFIGEIRTPYNDASCPRFADEPLPDTARIMVYPEYRAGLKELEKFQYIYVLFFLDRPRRECSLIAHPPKAQGREVGVFASRSPNRPSRIGLSVVRLFKIKMGVLLTSAIDAYDHTPLIDLKPYFRDDDLKPGANNGWLDHLPSGRAGKKRS